MHEGSRWLKRELSLPELGRLYQELAGEWLLLEILDAEPQGSPTRFRLHAHDLNKEKLHEFILEHDTWHWGKRYLLIQADPEKPCDIDLDLP